nr:hypothetical protein [Rhizobium leguminosarum]
MVKLFTDTTGKPCFACAAIAMMSMRSKAIGGSGNVTGNSEDFALMLVLCDLSARY